MCRPATPSLLITETGIRPEPRHACGGRGGKRKVVWSAFSSALQWPVRTLRTSSTVPGVEGSQRRGRSCPAGGALVFRRDAPHALDGVLQALINRRALTPLTERLHAFAFSRALTWAYAFALLRTLHTLHPHSVKCTNARLPWCPPGEGGRLRCGRVAPV